MSILEAEAEAAGEGGGGGRSGSGGHGGAGGGCGGGVDDGDESSTISWWLRDGVPISRDWTEKMATQVFAGDGDDDGSSARWSGGHDTDGGYDLWDC